MSGKGSGRFIHDEDAYIEGDRLGDFDGLLFIIMEQGQHGLGETCEVPLGDVRLIAIRVASVAVDGAEDRCRIVGIHESAGAIVDRLAGDRCVVRIHDTMHKADINPFGHQFGLRIPHATAEETKCQRGVVLRSLVDEVSIDVLFDQAKPEETPGLVAAILEPRVEEIFTFVKRDFGDLRELANLGAGVVLTGGGSRCRGTRQLCEEVFDLPVSRRHLPVRLRGADRLPGGQWATVLGLSLWAAGDFSEGEAHVPGPGGGGLLGKLRGMFRRGSRETMEAEA